ncbi:hypothetical protein SAMN05878281_1301 [Salegentibacter salegens]|uniref:Uncharacterized protein n=1 Tax=Salegentibacter salegens TaxID=143223 RepID=A0A1M7K9X8_9FLAO|nr:hypothetical protein LY58_02153 [Salegentibacter salegens]SHM61637.1 hypothetical protein SAMN05878281_1301 [Salegentibacter salegens]
MVEAIDHRKERETVAKWLDLKSLFLNKGNSAFVYLKVLREGSAYSKIKNTQTCDTQFAN